MVVRDFPAICFHNLILHYCVNIYIFLIKPAELTLQAFYHQIICRDVF